MPYHGYRDRMTDAIANLRAADLEAAALRSRRDRGAVRRARRRARASRSARRSPAGSPARTRIDTAIAVAPFCGLRDVPGALNDALGAVLRRRRTGSHGGIRASRKRSRRRTAIRVSRPARWASRCDSRPRSRGAARAARPARRVDPQRKRSGDQQRARAAQVRGAARLGVEVDEVTLQGMPHDPRSDRAADSAGANRAGLPRAHRPHRTAALESAPGQARRRNGGVPPIPGLVRRVLA